MKFKDHTIWITGASSGIGAALAAAFADEGARCALSARRTDRLEAVRASMQEPERHIIVPLDAAAYDTHDTAAEDVEKRLGPLDVVVLNAGVGQRGFGLETELAVVQRIMDVNFTGTVSLARLVGERMVERGRGRIVVVSSVLGHVSIPGSTSYSASKHALQGYFNSLRAELHPHGVGVTVICPGFIRTEISEKALLSDGSTWGRMDENHQRAMTAEEGARRMLRAIGRGKAEFRVGGLEIWAIPLARHFPGLARRIARRYARK